MKYPQQISHLPPLAAIFLSAPLLTWNSGSAPGNKLSVSFAYITIKIN